MPGLKSKPSIVFENEEFWVINKPAGWTVQKDDHAPGVLAWLTELTGAVALPVHRIDKPTTGLLLVAKTNHANSGLSTAFQERKVTKVYLAISDQKPKKKQGWVKGDMAPSRRGQYKLLRSQENPAITQFNSTALGQGMRGYWLFPKTGKTHQLRVAMKSLGSPILGDSQYAGSSSEQLYLHAWSLSFNLNGESFSFQVKPPESWFSLWPETDMSLDNEG